MFTVYTNKGFKVTFDNGLTVSVMFGTVNYCSNRNADNGTMYELSSQNAEIAVFKNGEMITSPFTPDGYNPVVGWQSPTDMLTIMEWASRQ